MDTEKQAAITEETPVQILVQFTEPNGSKSTLPWIGKVKDLGITINPNAAPQRPTPEEFDAALLADEKNPPRRPQDGEMVKLGAKYNALNQDRGRDIGLRIREAAARLLTTDGLPGHKIDGKNYSWADSDPTALNVVDLHDDAKGTVTGTANALYLQVAASAVWGE